MAEEKVSMTVALRGVHDALGKGQYQEVVKLCKLLLKQDRNNYDAYVLLGSALVQLKQYVPAEKSLQLAVGVNASKMASWQRLVELYEATGNAKELVEACQATRDRAEGAGKTDRYLEYTRKLAAAHCANLNFKEVCNVWQGIIDNIALPEEVQNEAKCALIDAKSTLLDNAIQEEYRKRLAQQDRASKPLEHSKEEVGSSESSTATFFEDILLTVEEQFVDNELSKELENLLRNFTTSLGTSLKHHQELLLQLLLRRARATHHSAGNDWRTAKLQVLQQCLAMIVSHQEVMAFEVVSKFLEDDDGDEILGEIVTGSKTWKQFTEPVSVWFGKLFAHVYPGHGLALAALAHSMHCSQSDLSLERKRMFCEKALRLEDNSSTGWQVLAEVHGELCSYSSALECVRRGLNALRRSRAKYGLSLRVAEIRFQMTLGQTHLATQNYTEADSTFQYVAEEANALLSKEGLPLMVAANEGLAKVALARGEVELARARLSVVLSVNSHNHWALAEQGWLAFQEGDQNEAVQYLERAVALHPDDASYHRRLGLLYWKAGGRVNNLKDKAVSQFLEAVKLDPSQSDVFRLLGHYYRDTAGDRQRAAHCYQKSITLDPEDDEAGEALCNLVDSEGQELLEVDICRGASQRSRRAYWACRRLGFLQVHRKDWTGAVPNLQHALRGCVTDPDLWEALGLAYQHLGMHTAALKAYGRVTTLGSNSPVFALLQSGNILLLLASYGRAVDVFRKALEKVPQHAGAVCGLAAALLGRARECIVMGAFSWSATLANDAIQLLSQSTTSCSNVGAFWKLFGDLEVTYAQSLPCDIMEPVNFSSCDLKAKSLHLRTEIELWHQIRLSALRKGMRAYQRALHLCPSQGSLYCDIGVVFDLISSLEKEEANVGSSWLPAVIAVCGGLRLDGDKPDLWVSLGMLTKHKGLRQHAFIQALRIDATHALAWGGLGQLYVGEGQEELAKDAFDRARCANPALPLPWAGMAFIHSFIGSEKDLQEAYASCLYAVQLSPTIEVQLGLGKLAALTQQLQASEVYTALEQAVQHAPHRPEAHNLRGLACESRGDNKGAVQAYLRARYALALPLSATHGSPSRESIAVSLNLARGLCKAGAARAAVQEYEHIAELGFLQEDAGALRGYAVALWEAGSKDKALIFAKMSVEVDANAANTVCGLALVSKMFYTKFGSSYTLEEIRKAPRIALLNAKYFLSSLAVAILSGDDHIVSCLMDGICSSFSHETSIKALLLVAAAQQITPGKQDQKSVVQQLQKALHVYPQSCSIRAKLGEVLLEKSYGEEPHLVGRCCLVPLSHAQQNADYGSLCSSLAVAACACALCGQLVSFNFSTCQGVSPPVSSLLRYLQRWVHKEPWNLKARYHLVLTLLQQARAQDYPVNLCRGVLRMAETALSLLLTIDCEDLSILENVHLFLLVAKSECDLHVGDYHDAIQVARTAVTLNLSRSAEATAVLQLARCYAALQDLNSLQVELSRALKLLSPDNVRGWLTLIELEQQIGFQENSSSVRLCRDAILKGDLNVQSKWMGNLHLVCAKGFIQAGDLRSAQKVTAEALVLLPDYAIFHLLHGALCLELVSKGSNTELLPAAVRSLSKAVACSRNGTLPLASVLLCKAQMGKGSSRNSDLLKWERKLWAEWGDWPPEARPAEVYFQMGLVLKKAQGTLTGTAGVPEMSWTARAWLQRAVHLTPDLVAYRTYLQEL